MIGRNYFFSKMTAYDIKATMYAVQTAMEAPLQGTDPATWCDEFKEIHKESHNFSVVMWDLVYAVDFDPSDLMWDPINMCYVHIEHFFDMFGVQVDPTPDVCVTYDAYDLDFTDDSSVFSGITFDMDNLHDMLSPEEQEMIDLQVEVIDLTDDKENNI
jgi:hypothetical protein